MQDEAAPEREIRAVAIRLLARREHAPVELARKLAQRGFEKPLIDAELESLVDLDLLSSARYAQSLVRARVDKGRGPERIRQELARNGIHQSLMEQALVEEQPDWVTLARRERVKRFGAAVPGEFPARARQMRFLQQRGFSVEHIQAAFEPENGDSWQ